jgi:hypothetical protein
VPAWDETRLTNPTLTVQENSGKEAQLAAAPQKIPLPYYCRRVASIPGLAKERPLERIVERGVFAGLVAGGVVALFAMMASATWQGRGFFTPMYHAAFVVDPQTLNMSLTKAAAGEHFYFAREAFTFGLIVYWMVGGAFGALFGLLARALRLRGARAIAGGLAYGLLAMVLMSLVVLPQVASMSGAGRPIAHMADDIGWPTFAAHFAVFGVALGVWVFIRPQDIGDARRHAPN